MVRPFAILLACALGIAARAALAGEFPAEFLVAQAAEPPASPCGDSLYLELRGQSLDAMSEREYEYFMRKDKECDAYRARLVAPDALRTTGPVDQVAAEVTADSVSARGGGMLGGHALGVILVSVMATLMILFVSNN